MKYLSYNEAKLRFNNGHDIIIKVYDHFSNKHGYFSIKTLLWLIDKDKQEEKTTFDEAMAKIKKKFNRKASDFVYMEGHYE